MSYRRNIQDINVRCKYAALMIKKTHRNMRKLASIYKEVKDIPDRGVSMRRLSFTKRYRKHPNFDGLGRNPLMKRSKYFYLEMGSFYYSQPRLYKKRSKVINHIDSKNEMIIRFILKRLTVKESMDRIPF